MAYATPGDVAVPLLRPLSDAETAYAEKLLEWAEKLIEVRFGGLDDLDQTAIIMVESQAVARVLRNPEGKTQESLAGEYQATRGGRDDGILRITDEEWELLAPAGSLVKSGAFSIDTAPTLTNGHSQWCWWMTDGTCTCGVLSVH